MSTRGPDRAALMALLQARGFDSESAASIAARFDGLLGQLSRDGAGRKPDAWFVPGRIEILGKHTDYAGGRSLICAAERGLCVASARREDELLRVTDIPRATSLVLAPTDEHSPLKWGTYPLTVLRRLRRNFDGPLHGADVYIDSDLPSAGGLSSSSALMIGALLALARVNGLEETSTWRANIRSEEDLAAYAATIENGSDFRELGGDRGVGTEGGSQDHTAILCSARDRIAQYSYRPTCKERTIALQPRLTFAVAMSGVRAQKTGNARDDYNRAARSVGRALALWNAGSGRRDETLMAALSSTPDAATALRSMLVREEPALVDRVDQFVEESLRLVPAAADQLERGDLGAFGETVERSQALAETHLRNQVPQTASLARLARQCGAFAASAFGAGFGGSVWALIDRGEAATFLDRWQNAYTSAHPESATRAMYFLTRPGPAAFRLADGDR